ETRRAAATIGNNQIVCALIRAVDLSDVDDGIVTAGNGRSGAARAVREWHAVVAPLKGKAAITGSGVGNERDAAAAGDRGQGNRLTGDPRCAEFQISSPAGRADREITDVRELPAGM